jgi:hypothetical protein
VLRNTLYLVAVPSLLPIFGIIFEASLLSIFRGERAQALRLQRSAMQDAYHSSFLPIFILMSVFSTRLFSLLRHFFYWILRSRHRRMACSLEVAPLTAQLPQTLSKVPSYLHIFNLFCHPSLPADCSARPPEWVDAWRLDSVIFYAFPPTNRPWASESRVIFQTQSLGN